MKKNDTLSTVLGVALIVVVIYLAVRLIKVIIGLLSAAVFSLFPLITLALYIIVIIFMVKFALNLFKKS